MAGLDELWGLFQQNDSVINTRLAKANHTLVSAVEFLPGRLGIRVHHFTKRVTPLKAAPTSSNLPLHHASGGTYPSQIPQFGHFAVWRFCIWRYCTWPREIKISKPGGNPFLLFLCHVAQWQFAASLTANSECSRNNCDACWCIDTKGSFSLNIYDYLEDIPFPGYQITPWRWCSLWFLILMALSCL